MLVWFLSTMRFMRIIIITTEYRKMKRIYLTLCEAFQSKGPLSSTEHIFGFYNCDSFSILIWKNVNEGQINLYQYWRGIFLYIRAQL